MNKGLYGLPQGNENRPEALAFAERLNDNEIVEGKVVADLNALWMMGLWESFDSLISAIRSAWYSLGPDEELYRRAVDRRLESILSRATFKSTKAIARRREIINIL